MLKNQIYRIILCLPVIFTGLQGRSQISPGDLAEPHAHLEGISNCTKCHILGEKVSNEKCLDCHQLLKSRVDQKKGYHASTDVAGKECVSCHSDHHGRNFELIRFKADQFNHNLTGYVLEGKHAGKQCNDCHKPEFISNPEARKKKSTYLGLNTDCLSCHEDYHQKTLSANCASCHNFEGFKQAPKFEHNNTDYKLLGKHLEVDCIKCHKKEIRDGRDFQVFKGLDYNNCSSCHTDVHQNKFGQNCTQCHTEESFHVIKKTGNFNHSLTDYPLEGKHLHVDCKACHKTKYTDPIITNRCTNCHSDYHKNQFEKQGKSPDCADCHSVFGFNESSYTIGKHNESHFPLKGAHEATPCFACHKKETRWEFRKIGLKCIDCHENIHDPYLDKKYYPEASCESCHGESRWSDISFNHSQTKYELEGAHKKQSCRDCHFKTDLQTGKKVQQFTGIRTNCANCHKDIHYGQFDKDGETECKICHTFDDWKAGKFDHDKTRFMLDGAHRVVACTKCHKPVVKEQYSYILYKLEKFQCKDCH
ncbi:MAG: cytochrome C [Bacteroidales bacterium]|nr:cytochrome C [Bacteroidales bacterium]